MHAREGPASPAGVIFLFLSAFGFLYVAAGPGQKLLPLPSLDDLGAHTLYTGGRMQQRLCRTPAGRSVGKKEGLNSRAFREPKQSRWLAETSPHRSGAGLSQQEIG